MLRDQELTFVLDSRKISAPMAIGVLLLASLAVTAATLALYGYHIDCVCYSSNLSGRDFESFQGLFEALNLTVHSG